MLKSFKSKALRDFWIRGIDKGIKPEWRDRVHDLLSSLDAADSPQDMRLPTYAFHPLKGNRKGEYAVTIRANWLITFAWDGGGAVRVDMEDYHGR
jgi:proteic killer suppression protein